MSKKSAKDIAFDRGYEEQRMRIHKYEAISGPDWSGEAQMLEAQRAELELRIEGIRGRLLALLELEQERG